MTLELFAEARETLEAQNADCTLPGCAVCTATKDVLRRCDELAAANERLRSIVVPCSECSNLESLGEMELGTNGTAMCQACFTAMVEQCDREIAEAGLEFLKDMEEPTK